MSEYSGRVPVASLRKRHVYKTEFDIFKQNTDIDLISLISYDEERPEIDLKVSYRDFKSKNSQIGNVTSSHNSGESQRSIKSLVRSSLINKEKKDNTQIKGVRQNERACKSAVNYKGINSRCRDVTQRSKTAFGSRVVERKSDYIKKDYVTNENKASSCLRYKGCSSASQVEDVRSERLRVRSVSAYGYTDRNSLKPGHRNYREPIINSQYKQQIRPKTVVGSRNESKNSIKSTNVETKPLKKLCYQSFENKKKLQVELQESHVETVFLEEHKHDEHQSKLYRNESSQGSDLSESAKVDECMDSKDSGYQGSEYSPDLDKVKEDLWITTPEQEVTEPRKEDTFEQSPIKKQVTFEELSESHTCLLDSEEALDSVSLDQDDIVSDLDDASDKASEASTESAYDFTCLLIDLEENSLEVKTADVIRDSVSVGASECNSILDETTVNASEVIEEVEQQHEEHLGEIEYNPVDKCDILNESAMSREAKYAIIETLQDMKVSRSSSNMYRLKNKENSSASTLHKSVGMQRRLRDNRSKYDQYMRERTNTMSGINLHSQPRNRISNSVYSSDEESDDCDETSSSEKDNIRTNLLPSIGNVGTQTTVSNKTKIYSLEQAKRKKYKIPGIGNYDLVMSPEAEFEITPPGFDSRYNPRPIISKDEMEPPPRLIRERSIQKCKKWLKNVNLSPLSLNPANKQ